MDYFKTKAVIFTTMCVVTLAVDRSVGSLIQCRHRNLYVDCSHLNLISVPSPSEKERQAVKLDLEMNKVKYIHPRAFINYTRLEYLKINDNKLSNISVKAFYKLHRLHYLRLSNNRLKELNSAMFLPLSSLQTLDLHSNMLSAVPVIESFHLHILILDNNRISSLENDPFRHLESLTDLSLSSNYIRTIPRYTFSGLQDLKYLNLQNNVISTIDSQAFQRLHSLMDLNLAANNVATLPTDGLQNLCFLRIHENELLTEIPPSIYTFRLHYLSVPYAYHCCAFENYINNNKTTKEVILHNNEAWLQEIDHEENNTSIIEYSIPDYSLEMDDSLDTCTKSLEIPSTCEPKPGPFMPCYDLFDWWALRIGIWLVCCLSLIGNGLVIFITCFHTNMKIDVTRFLVCNLALADLLMSIYLGILAVVDISTLGLFRQYAISWQRSPGCRVAGFLAVLSSEMSVFVLVALTLERLYSISHALHLDKKISLQFAIGVTASGWGFSATLAILPLFGFSDYRKFAICLPFEVSNRKSLAYITFLMAFNGISFFVIVVCYIIMFCVIHRTRRENSSDASVAKRIALIVFTDFACWAPITVFSLTSSFGYNLISLKEAKVFAVFILPINSCVNPFLYAICTKNFKNDCCLIMRRLKSSFIYQQVSEMTAQSFLGRRFSGSSGISLTRRTSLIPPANGPGPHQNATQLGQTQMLLNDS